ncbi:hypothetical protein K469DRAFT_269522 [Zopfia rhizophila CBS 207.26]|uniref:Uncharacterized protein n=1 Tax=Zopfia rhizophila CBS 207.26 TaxID=1314779 RepID=A0A6A6DR89_9PEZI|nr:hypothetical protein K469DRAFT_269522 [Zopfia rhizophila CBS 207.26]
MDVSRGFDRRKNCVARCCEQLPGRRIGTLPTWATVCNPAAGTSEPANERRMWLCDVFVVLRSQPQLDTPIQQLAAPMRHMKSPTACLIQHPTQLSRSTTTPQNYQISLRHKPAPRKPPSIAQSLFLHHEPFTTSALAPSDRPCIIDVALQCAVSSALFLIFRHHHATIFNLASNRQSSTSNTK